MEEVVNKGLVAQNRFFIPLIKPETPISTVQLISRHCSRIAFNHQKLISMKKSEIHNIRAIGLHDYFRIPPNVDMWLVTTAKDEFLKKYYSDGLKQFLKDLSDLRPDHFMSPDWPMYDKLSAQEREVSLKKAIELAEKCSGVEGMIPSANTVTAKQYIEFVNHFKPSGYNQFIMPGREYLMHNRGKKRNEQRLLTKIQEVVLETGVSIIVNGTSSPRQHMLLYPAQGFIGLNWQLHADNRRLLFNGRYVPILQDRNRGIICHNPSCCKGVVAYKLAEKEEDPIRYLHNLLAIQDNLTNKPEEISLQKTLGGL